MLLCDKVCHRPLTADAAGHANAFDDGLLVQSSREVIGVDQRMIFGLAERSLISPVLSGRNCNTEAVKASKSSVSVVGLLALKGWM